jgi:hypothetical protein
MKEQAIKKINSIGKVCSVFALIGKILVGMGIVVTLLAAIVCFVMPEDFMVITLDTNMDVQVDVSEFGVAAPKEELAEMQAEIEASFVEDGEGEVSEVILTEETVLVRGGVEDFSFTLRDVAWLMVLGMVALVMTFVTLIFIGGLCKAFCDCQSPFEDNVIKKMQYFAYSLIPWAIISTIANSITESITSNKPSFMFSIDLGIILVVLVVLVLVYIFKYGAILQQESDETL